MDITNPFRLKEKKKRANPGRRYCYNIIIDARTTFISFFCIHISPIIDMLRIDTWARSLSYILKINQHSLIREINFRLFMIWSNREADRCIILTPPPFWTACHRLSIKHFTRRARHLLHYNARSGYRRYRNVSLLSYRTRLKPIAVFSDQHIIIISLLIFDFKYTAVKSTDLLKSVYRFDIDLCNRIRNDDEFRTLDEIYFYPRCRWFLCINIAQCSTRVVVNE